jgi:hypothetical protein
LPTRWFAFLYSAILTLAFVAPPYKVTFDNHLLKLHVQTASAKDGGKGGGTGGGNTGDGGGNSGSKGGGNAGGTSGSKRGGNVAIDGSTMEVRHSNGMSERIKDGRYIMKDAKGRIIVNRTATTSDQSRLRVPLNGRRLFHCYCPVAIAEVEAHLEISLVGEFKQVL